MRILSLLILILNQRFGTEEKRMIKKTILTVVLLLVALALLMFNFTSGPTARSGTVAGEILGNAGGSRLDDVSNLKRYSLDAGGIERIFPAYEAIINASADAEVVDFAIAGARTLVRAVCSGMCLKIL